jgi:hypothetical protein
VSGEAVLRAFARREEALVVQAFLRAAAREAIQAGLVGDGETGVGDLSRPFTFLAERAFIEVLRREQPDLFPRRRR